MTILSRLFVPTQSKRLNELIGILLFATAVLMILAMASYSPLDRSLNTAANPPIGRPAHNWIGLVGAYSADLMLQAMGVIAFLLPVMLLFLALRWMRSRTVENPVLKAVAALSLVAFASALLALLPWPMRWVHAVPVEGLLGRVLGDLLVHYFNYAGACIVVLTAIAAALYMATAFSLSSIRLWSKTRFTFFYALRDRFQDWRTRRDKAHELKLLARKQRLREQQAEAEAKRLAAAPASVAAAPPIMQEPLDEPAAFVEAAPLSAEPNARQMQPSYRPPRRSEGRPLSGIERMQAASAQTLA